MQCQKQFNTKEECIEYHNKPSIQALGQKHTIITMTSVLGIVSQLLEENNKMKQQISALNEEVQKQRNIISFDHQTNAPLCFVTNIKLDLPSTPTESYCILNFQPKEITFKVLFKGTVKTKSSKNFLVTINFPLPIALFSFANLEEQIGCARTSEYISFSEGTFKNSLIINPVIDQKGNQTTLFLQDNERNKINWKNDLKDDISFSFSGVLKYLDINFSLNEEQNYVIFNINQKRFLSCKEGKWSFIEDFMDKTCIVKIKISQLFLVQSQVSNEYLSYTNKSVIATPKFDDNSQLNITFKNSKYGVCSIGKDGLFLNCTNLGEAIYKETDSIMMICPII